MDGNTSTSATSGTDENEEGEDEKSESALLNERRKEKEEEELNIRNIMQADVNSRIRQLLTMALKSLKKAHLMSKQEQQEQQTNNKKTNAKKNKRDNRNDSSFATQRELLSETNIEMESYTAAILFLQAELFLRSYVFIMKPFVSTIITDNDNEDQDQKNKEEKEEKEERITVKGNRRATSKSMEQIQLVNEALYIDITETSSSSSGTSSRGETSATQILHWELNASDNGCRVLDGLLRRYDRQVVKQNGSNNIYLSEKGLYAFTTHLIPQSLLLKQNQHNEQNETQLKEMYHSCIERYSTTGATTESTESTKSTESTDNSASSSDAILPSRSSFLDSICFRRLVAHRALIDPVPLWKMLQGSMKMPGGAESIPMYALSAVKKLRNFQSARHFSVSSGLSDHPINTFSNRLDTLEEELLNIAGVDDTTKNIFFDKEKNQKIFKENEKKKNADNRLNTSENQKKVKRNSGSNKNKNLPTPIIRRDSRRMDEGMLSDYMSENDDDHQVDDSTHSNTDTSDDESNILGKERKSKV